MTKKSFSFSKDFFGSGLLEVLEKEKTSTPLSVHLKKGGGDMKVFFVGLLY